MASGIAAGVAAGVATGVAAGVAAGVQMKSGRSREWSRGMESRTKLRLT